MCLAYISYLVESRYSSGINEHNCMKRRMRWRGGFLISDMLSVFLGLEKF